MISTVARRTGGFTPQVIASLNRAYTSALRVLNSRDYGLDARVKVAEQMVALAQAGETNEAKLCSLSLRAALERSLNPSEKSGASDLWSSEHAPAQARRSASGSAEPSLCEAEMVALRQACGPVGVLGFPPTEVIHVLRRLGYITIVLGGVQITPLGLERLLRERARCLETS